MKYLLSLAILLLICCSPPINEDAIYVSSYMVDENGETQAPNYSIIQKKNDSLFYIDLYKTNSKKIVGQIPEGKTEAVINNMKFSFKENALEVSNSEFKSFYRILESKARDLKISESYFLNQQFILKSNYTNDTIIFNNSSSYQNLTSENYNRWSLAEVEGYQVLWLDLRFDEVPLIIQSKNDKMIKATLYALEKEEVTLKKVGETD